LSGGCGSRLKMKGVDRLRKSTVDVFGITVFVFNRFYPPARHVERKRRN
jgi:hypothetical protein